MEKENFQDQSKNQLLERQISRRNALKAGGVAAVGLAFSKPLIETLRPRPAFAALSPLPGGPTEMPISGAVSDVGIPTGESVDHFTEQDCPTVGTGNPFAGARVLSAGNASPLGNFTGSASAAWDWGTLAAGVFIPVAGSHGGTVTTSSATVIGSYPQSFCSSSFEASGIAIMKDTDGDELIGTITGGEIYEVNFGLFPGDGQESFLTVVITGGSGKWAGATGSYVTHSIIKVTAVPSLVVVFSEISGSVFV